MPNLRSVANEYHAHANALAARGDKAGKLSPNRARAIAYYRGAAAAIEALISPEDEVIGGVVWVDTAKKAAVAPTEEGKK